MIKQAFIHVKAVPGSETEVITQLAEEDPEAPKTYKIKGVKEVFTSQGESGMWTAIVVVEAADDAGISKIEAQIKNLQKKTRAMVVTQTRIVPCVGKPMGDP